MKVRVGFDETEADTKTWSLGSRRVGLRCCDCACGVGGVVVEAAAVSRAGGLR